MKAVLLVGGEGTRLRPLTCNTVKAMVPVVNRPFLEHLLEYLASHGVDDIVVTLCYLPDRIESRFGRGGRSGVRLTYVTEESPLGTAGAVKNAEQYLNGPFFVFNGDVITSIDITAMLAFHRQRKALATIALTPVDNPSAYGVVETGSDGRVKRFIEKPAPGQAPTNLINAGIYILEHEVLKRAPQGSRCMFEYDVFPGLLAENAPIYGYATKDYWIDIGTPEKYRQVQYDLLSGKCRSPLYEKIKGNDHGYSRRTGIHPCAVMEGPLLLGEKCYIGAGARIKGPAVLGEGCSVADNAVIDKAIIWRNVRIGEGASIRESIVGDNCRLGDRCSVEASSTLGDNVVVTDGTRVAANQKVWPDTTL